MKFYCRVLSALLLAFTATVSLAQESRLSNLAIRAQGGGGDTLITGFSIGPGASKTVLIRAVGPTLGAFGVGGTLADPKLELYSGTNKIGENDNWNASDAATFASVGAFALGANSRDAALVATLPPGSYTAQVSGAGAGGVTLVEVYELSGSTTRLINLSTRAHVGTGDNILVPGITISPGSGSRRLLIRAVGPTLGAFGVSGTIADPKLELFSGSTKTAENDNWGTPVGTGSATAEQLSAAFTAAGAFALGAGSRDAALLGNMAPGSYTLQVSGVGNTTGAALVEVYDLTPPPPATTLYLAQLRPDASAAGSTASGFATLLLSADGASATLSVSFSNLSAAQTAGHLSFGTGNDYVFNLTLGQISDRLWTFAPTAGKTTAQLIDALKTGNITISLDSAKFPSGELRGTFIHTNGSQTFVAPAAPPALPASALTAPTKTDAARFLTQATFGPTFGEIDALMSKGIIRWIDEQMALPPTLLLTGTRADRDAFPTPPAPPTIVYVHTQATHLRAAWTKIAVTAPDQLRQRVAFALSQIFVISLEESQLSVQAESVSSFYDILVRHAFGDFRKMLEEVTLHPAMGQYLSHIQNQKADPAKGTSPDENYAREVQQLFTIGLVQLQPDGTLMLDAEGKPIPTYDQAIISDTANVLTGWTFANQASTVFTVRPPQLLNTGAPDGTAWMVPMRYSDAQHEKAQKQIVSTQQVALEAGNRTVVPAGQTGPQDLKILLDTLFIHPNTGPFISRLLIQRLVTSNPSPGYIYRVAQKFADDGTGIRGNLGAVVRAILTDYEARSPDLLSNIGFGKIKEPAIRLMAMFRALSARAANGRFLDSYFGDVRSSTSQGYSASGTIASATFGFGQGPLRAPSVFNFYSPDYTVPGPLAAAGLVAPELEITDAINAVLVPNTLVSYVHRDVATLPVGPSPSPWLVMDFTPFLPNARNIPALIDQVNLLFASNQMTAAARAQLTTTLQALPTATTDLARVQTAVHLAIVSPNGAFQR